MDLGTIGSLELSQYLLLPPPHPAPPLAPPLPLNWVSHHHSPRPLPFQMASHCHWNCLMYAFATTLGASSLLWAELKLWEYIKPHPTPCSATSRRRRHHHHHCTLPHSWSKMGGGKTQSSPLFHASQLLVTAQVELKEKYDDDAYSFIYLFIFSQQWILSLYCNGNVSELHGASRRLTSLSPRIKCGCSISLESVIDISCPIPTRDVTN